LEFTDGYHLFPLNVVQPEATRRKRKRARTGRITHVKAGKVFINGAVRDLEMQGMDGLKRSIVQRFFYRGYS
jgi:hypothetical protein